MMIRHISSASALWIPAVCLLLVAPVGCRAGRFLEDFMGADDSSSRPPLKSNELPAKPEAEKEEQPVKQEDLAASDRDAPEATQEPGSPEDNGDATEEKAKKTAGKSNKTKKKKGSNESAKAKKAILDALRTDTLMDTFGTHETEAQKKKQKEKAWKCVARESKKAGFKGKYCDPKCNKCMDIHLKCEVYGKDVMGGVFTAHEPDYCPK